MRKSILLGVLAALLLLQGCATNKPDKNYTCRQYFEKQEMLTRNNAWFFPNQENPCDSLDPSITPPPFAAQYGVNYYPTTSGQQKQ